MVAFLDEAIRSVLAQDYARIEYIVLDGGSTDGSADILDRYRGVIEVIVAPDDGPADCIQKGFGRASGEILAWLSADDVLLPNAVREAVEALARNPSAAGVYGDAQWISGSGATIGAYPTGDFAANRLERECFICQPACFFRTSTFQSAGGMDVGLRYTFDWDLWIRMSRVAPFVHVTGQWARSRMHATNISLGQKGRVLDESIALLRRHARYVPVHWVYGWLSYADEPSDQFFQVPRRSPARYLRALYTGARWNSGQMARYAGEWFQGLRAHRSSSNRPDGG